MGDLDFAVKYPFSADAKEAMADMDVTDEIVEKAVRLILASLGGELPPKAYAEDYEKKEDIAAYAVARMILGTMRNRYIIGKFSVAVSKLARKSINSESSEGIRKLLEEFKIRIKSSEIYIADYLRFTPRDTHYSLFNRDFSNGWVKIKESEKQRIIEEAVRKHVEDVPFVKTPLPIIKKAIERIEREMPKREERRIAIKEGDYPPCIVYLLEEVKKHHNLPHHARWFLAVYLIAGGMDDEQIISIFSNFPDFSEKITRYQIVHARKRGYSVPTCATIASYGLCRADCGIKSPLGWRRRRK
jgi:DNA primase large subunit